MKNPFRKKSQLLDPAIAEQMLGNVFAACGRDPNTVPYETLISYSNYRKERYTFQRSVIITVLVLFLLLPTLFFASTITVTLRNSGSQENPIYDVHVNTTIPIRLVQAAIDGKSVPIYEASDSEYVITPNRNGEMDISVTLINRQISSLELTVSTVDSDAPVLTSTEMDSDSMRLYVIDDNSKVDFDGVEVRSSETGELLEYTYDTKAGCITIDYPEEQIEVSVPDVRGNVLSIRLKPQI